MAKITRTQQRRLVASSIAFFLAAAIMMPSSTDARGGGHGSGGHHIGNPGFGHRHVIISSHPGFFVALRSFPHHVFSHRRLALHHSHTIGSHFFTLGPDSFGVDNFAPPPAVVVTEGPAITQEPVAPRHLAVVRTPDAEQSGILLVRGNSKAYVTFPSEKPG